MTSATSYWQIGIIFLLFGIGTGVGFPSLLNATLALAPKNRRGMTSGILYATLFSGGSIGAIYVGSIIGIVAPSVLWGKLHTLGMSFNHNINKMLVTYSTGVRDVFQLKKYFNAEQAKALISVTQQSFLHAFMIIMITSIFISIIIAGVAWFIKNDDMS